MKNIFKKLMLTTLISTPLLASDSEGVFAALGIAFVVFAIMFLITIFFLLSQSAFAKSMQTSDQSKNTSRVWIWTQLIPIWSLVAIPVTLIKLNEQFRVFISENSLGFDNSIKLYNNVWGWVWFFGTLVSLFIPFAGLISIIGVIGFWIHINGVRKSLLRVNNINN